MTIENSFLRLITCPTSVHHPITTCCSGRLTSWIDSWLIHNVFGQLSTRQLWVGCNFLSLLVISPVKLAHIFYRAENNWRATAAFVCFFFQWKMSLLNCYTVVADGREVPVTTYLPSSASVNIDDDTPSPRWRHEIFVYIQKNYVFGIEWKWFRKWQRMKSVKGERLLVWWADGDDLRTWSFRRIVFSDSGSKECQDWRWRRPSSRSSWAKPLAGRSRGWRTNILHCHLHRSCNESRRWSVNNEMRQGLWPIVAPGRDTYFRLIETEFGFSRCRFAGLRGLVLVRNDQVFELRSSQGDR